MHPDSLETLLTGNVSSPFSTIDITYICNFDPAEINDLWNPDTTVEGRVLSNVHLVHFPKFTMSSLDVSCL